MSTTQGSGSHLTAAPDTIHDAETNANSTLARRALATLRIAFGLTFLWAFFDKLLALGFATGRSVDPTTGAETVDRFGDAAWINGGSPTLGFLKYGADGPFDSFYHSIAGDTWTDWAFMLGLLGIGVTLTFGIGMRIGCIAGAVMYLLMWSVVLPPDNNPVIDDHILGAISMVVLVATSAGMTWGLGRRWAAVELVKRNPFLR